MSGMDDLRRILTARGARWRDYSSSGIARTVYRGRGCHVAAISGYGICGDGEVVAWEAGQEAAPPMTAEEVVRRYPPCGRPT